MIKKETFMPIQFFKKEAFTGSMKGMRYRVAESGEELEAVVYPGPYCYEVTPQEQKTRKTFPFSQEGIDQAVDWINDQFSLFSK